MVNEELDELDELVAPDEPEPEGPVVRVGILNDWVAGGGETPEQERESIIRELRANWAGGLNATMVWSAERPDFRDMPEVDILIVDYGALWQSGDLVEDYTQRVRDWADDHPGRLVVIWTSFTASIYRRVFEAEFKAHEFLPDPNYPDTCMAARSRFGDCGLPATAELHTMARTPGAGNVLLRYVSEYGLDGGEADTFWPAVRSWVGYPAVSDE